MHYCVNWPRYLCKHWDSPRKNLEKLWFTDFPLCVLNWWIPYCFPRGRGLWCNSIGAIHPLEKSESWRWCRCQTQWIARISSVRRGTRPRGLPGLLKPKPSPWIIYQLCSFTAPFPLWLFLFYFFCSVVPQTTVILNNDRQNSIVAKMVGQEEPLSRAADSLENILSKWVPFPGKHPQQVRNIPFKTSSASEGFPLKHPEQVRTIPWNPPSFPSWAGPLSKATWREKQRMFEVIMGGKIEPGLGQVLFFPLDGREHPGGAGIFSVLI